MSAFEQKFTQSSYDRMVKEVEKLKGQRAQVVEDIREAREQGDLRENFAYHDAKNAQGMLEANIAMVESRLAEAVIVEGESDEVMMGVSVKVKFKETGKTRSYIIVTPEELELTEGGASADSPVGVALLGQHVGAVVGVEGPNGTLQVEILAIGEG